MPQLPPLCLPVCVCACARMCVCLSVPYQSSPDQGETKSAPANPPAKMPPPKQPVYAVPGLAPFLTPSDLQAFCSGASPASLARTLGSKTLLPGLRASPPPPSFPLSPPLHQQLPLPAHAQGALLSPPVSMSPAPQPPVLPASMALQVQLAMSPSPPGPQVSVCMWGGVQGPLWMEVAA